MGQNRELSREPLGAADGLDEQNTRADRIGPVGRLVFAAVCVALGVWAALSADPVLAIGWGVLAVCWLVWAIKGLRGRREAPGQVSSSRRR